MTCEILLPKAKPTRKRHCLASPYPRFAAPTPSAALLLPDTHPTQFLLCTNAGSPDPLGPCTPPPLLHRHILVHLDLWLLHRQLQLLSPLSATPPAVDLAALMLRSACSRAAALAHDGLDVTPLEAACSSHRQRLDNLLQARAHLAAREHLLPGDASHALTNASLRLPTGVVPPPDGPCPESDGQAAAREGLRHLVLGDRAAVDAALGVCAYLQRAAVPGRQLLFSLADGGAGTSAFALEFATECGRLRGIWAREAEDAEARKQGHWAEVLRRKERADELRAQRQQLSAEIDSLEEEEKEHERLYRTTSYPKDKIHEKRMWSARHKLKELKSERWEAASELEEVMRAPAPVLQPLPSREGDALTWLFFLHMPPLLRHLSRASFLAQQALLPHPCTDHPKLCKAMAVADLETDLTAHYNAHRSK